MQMQTTVLMANSQCMQMQTSMLMVKQTSRASKLAVHHVAKAIGDMSAYIHVVNVTGDLVHFLKKRINVTFKKFNVANTIGDMDAFFFYFSNLLKKCAHVAITIGDLYFRKLFYLIHNLDIIINLRRKFLIN